ncbi:MAG: HAMP domain-containing sensor histidine kinase [Terracidiphilus sp.]|jgi:signal transduction histidine kinase
MLFYLDNLKFSQETCNLDPIANARFFPELAHSQIMRDRDWAELSVADTGTGIPESVRDRVFDPFFTTKEVGKGTGQGLMLAHAVVVKKHGGKIWYDSEVGKGTTFYVRLPLSLVTEK